MDLQTIFILIAIGVVAGVASGFLGVGGGIIIVPALIHLLKLPMPQAVGTSLFVICMPVVAMGLYNYAKHQHVQWHFGLVIASTFIIGGFFGSKLALKLNPAIVKLVFGVVMIYVAVMMIRSGLMNLKK